MKANRSTIIVPGILFLLILSGGVSLGDEVASDDFDFEVVCLNQPERVEGRLTFSPDRVVYQTGEAADPLHEWSYDQIEKIRLRHARLVEIELPAGEKFKFAPIGEYSFDETFAGFLRNAFAAAEIDL